MEATDTVAPLLSAHGLAVRFTLPDGERLAAVGPVSFDIPAGQFVSIVGPSGCGKSTLIRTFAGLVKPAQGEARLNGTPITRPSPRIGLMFQQANLLPWRTVLDNVALPLEIAGVSRAERYQTAHRLLAFLGLEGFAQVYPGTLSGGMAQRVALGRVLSQAPDVLLLDEPFGALDALTREQISFDLLRARRGHTVVMVTHDIREAVLLSDRVLVMSRRPGRIVADVPVPIERPRQPEHGYTQGYIETSRRVREAISREVCDA